MSIPFFDKNFGCAADSPFFVFVWLPIVDMMASTSMSDTLLQMLLIIAVMDMILMAAVMANLKQWFD